MKRKTHVGNYRDGCNYETPFPRLFSLHCCKEAAEEFLFPLPRIMSLAIIYGLGREEGVKQLFWIMMMDSLQKQFSNDSNATSTAIFYSAFDHLHSHKENKSLRAYSMLRLRYDPKSPRSSPYLNVLAGRMTCPHARLAEVKTLLLTTVLSAMMMFIFEG